MESEQFDTLARQLSGAGSSRRQALRALGSVLLGSACSGVAARLGLTAVAEAKQKHHKAQPKRQRKPQAEHKAQGQLQAEGKGKGKGNKKKKHKKPKLPPLPPGCQHCGTCQMCQDGACVGDPDLWLVPCLDSPEDLGGRCHVCAVDGSGRCEPLSNGSGCTDGDECSWCQNGQCVPKPHMDLEPCGSGSCHLCDNGVCTALSNGSDCLDEDGVCCNKICLQVPCPEGEKYGCATGKCECRSGRKRCSPGDPCIPEEACCPNDPTCQQCPAGSEDCPGVPWDWYEWLPHGCCPADHYFPDPRDGRYVCSSPPGQPALWAVCEVGA